MTRGGSAAALRRDEIAELARTSGLASVEELSARFGVTASTVRRDLAALQAQGLLARTYGGAMALPSGETTVGQRFGEAHTAKRAIGEWCAARVEPGQRVLLDAGTTVAAVAHALRHGPGVRVTTCGLPSLGELAGHEQHEVECTGGTLRPVSQSFVGPLAEAALDRRTFDHAFLGADGVTAAEGICEADPRQTRLKELMADRAAHVYVVVHAAKLGRRPFHAWAPLRPGWTLVTDAGATDADLAPFRDAGLTVVRA